VTPLPFSHGVPSVLFAVGIAAILGVQIRTAVTSNLTIFRSRGTTQRLDRWSLPLVGLTTGAGVILAVNAAIHLPGTAIAADVPAVRWVLLVLGVGAMLAGSALRQWAVSTLGRYFTFDVRIAQGQTVVEGGPYRWVRHPSYTGLLVSLVGIGLALGDWLSVLLVAVLSTAGLVFRVQVEEAALREGLGAPYERFAATRRRLVPGIW
jgi:protein-S-isoprenylcysteine O-methyltransferase Ste14